MPRGKIDRTIFCVPPIHERNLPRNEYGNVIVTENFHNNSTTRYPKESSES